MATILVVDDEPDIITLLKILLEKEGYTVLEASNGQVALERLGVEPPNPSAPRPDLIILDIMMPVMDGHALNTRLQSQPEMSGIPVLILTAKGEKMRDLFQVAPNVAAYVQKPFEPKRLKSLVAGIIAGTNH